MMSYQPPSSLCMDRRNLVVLPHPHHHPHYYSQRGGVIVVSPSGRDVVSSDQSTSSSSNSMCGTHHLRYQPSTNTSSTAYSLNLHQQTNSPVLSSAGIPIVRIPSTHSAFRTVRGAASLVAPPLPPKSEEVRQRALRLANAQNLDQQECVIMSPKYNLSSPLPIPKPRLSKMKSLTELSSSSQMDVPVPKPRRLTSEAENIFHVPDQTTRKSSAKSCHSLTRCSVASVKRRSGAHRPATPIIHVTEPDQFHQPTSTTNVMDESERAYLEEAVRQTYSEDTSDSEDSHGSAPYGHILRFPRKEPSLPSPTTDSGLPHSDYDDKRHQGSEKSTDDGFFDASLIRKEEEDDDASEILTSISNQKPNETFADEEVRGRGISLLEKNARVMRWIHDS